MAGFLSRYNVITRIEIEPPSDGQPEGYWAEVKTHLSRRDAREANDALYRLVMKLDVQDEAKTDGSPLATAEGELHFEDYNTAIALAALVTWNLTDEDGVILSLDTPAAKLESLNRLPTEVFSQIIAAVQGVAKGAKDKKGGASERKFPR